MNIETIESDEIIKTIPIIINASFSESLSEIHPKSGAIIAKNALIIRLLIDNIVALASDAAIMFTMFFKTGVAIPLTA